MSVALSVSASVLAKAADHRVSPGLLGFVVVALLGVATWLLIRSMRRQLRRIDIPGGGTSTRGSDGPDRRPPEPPAERPSA